MDHRRKRLVSEGQSPFQEVTGSVQRTPVVADLTPELRQLQRQWLSLPREQQDLLYAREFGPSFARLFAQLPLHGAPPGFPKPRALISVLGFSWQPVALMAAWSKPERMLVIGTRESLGSSVGGEDVLSVISRISGTGRGRIEARTVEEENEGEIYRLVRDFLRSLAVQPRQVVIDLTGGKKAMSAAAALAGFVAGALLVYVDYARYDVERRIPVAGTEYPRLLENPLQVFGDLELREIMNAFNRGDFNGAERLALRLAQRLYEPREAECLACLARGYGLWRRFRFTAAREQLQKVVRSIEQFARHGRWAWAERLRERIEQNLSALDQLVRVPEYPDSIEQGLPLLLWYLAAIEKLLEEGEVSEAVLLTYAAVERYAVLCLAVDWGLDPNQPDYRVLEGQLDLERYHQIGRLVFGEQYERREPRGKIGFQSGLHLLAALDPDRLRVEDLRLLRDLAQTRNKCQYEHGFLPQVPRAKQARSHLERTRQIIARLCGGMDTLEERLEQYRFPVLEIIPEA